MQRQCEARDRLDDPHHSGPAPAFVAWVNEIQLPALAQRPQYAQQFRDRCTELEMKLANLEREIATGRLDLEPAAGMVRREIDWITALVEVPCGS